MRPYTASEGARGTLQSNAARRLVKEMRLNGITGIEAANAFAATFIALWNKKFTVPARDEANAHRPWKESEEALTKIHGAARGTHVVQSPDLQPQWDILRRENRGPGTAMRGGKITLYHFMNGTMRARYKGKWLTCTAYKTRGRPAAAEDDKSLNARMDAVVARTKADAGQGFSSRIPASAWTASGRPSRIHGDLIEKCQAYSTANCNSMSFVDDAKRAGSAVNRVSDYTTCQSTCCTSDATRKP